MQLSIQAQIVSEKLRPRPNKDFFLAQVLPPPWFPSECFSLFATEKSLLVLRDWTSELSNLTTSLRVIISSLTSPRTIFFSKLSPPLPVPQRNKQYANTAHKFKKKKNLYNFSSGYWRLLCSWDFFICWLYNKLFRQPYKLITSLTWEHPTPS